LKRKYDDYSANSSGAHTDNYSLREDTDYSSLSYTANSSSSFTANSSRSNSSTGNSNLIMASLDFTAIKKCLSRSIDDFKPRLRLLLKVFDKGYIHLNCKDPLLTLSLSGRFDSYCLA
jgi:hypothetical protein